MIEDGTVKVADFGIAHIETSNMTQAGAVLGTPAYMSPEQILGLPVDGRSDLFSAGVILYQFLTGERPFSGSSTATMHKVLEEEPLPPSRFNVQVPGAMDARRAQGAGQAPRGALPERRRVRRRHRRGHGGATPGGRRDAGRAGGCDGGRPRHRGARRDACARRAAPAAAAPRRRAGARRAAAGQEGAGRRLIAIGGGLAVVAIVAGVWMTQQRAGGDAPKVAQAPAPASRTGRRPRTAAPAVPPPAPRAAPARRPLRVAPPPPPAAPKTAPGMLTISAVGLVDPKDPRYGSDKALLQTDLRADSKAPARRKGAGPAARVGLAREELRRAADKLLAKSGSFITTVVRESAPRERQGRPRVDDHRGGRQREGAAEVAQPDVARRAHRVHPRRRRSEDRGARSRCATPTPPNAPAQPSPVAENLLKERIKSFGFRTWSDDAGAAAQRADFAVQGEAQIKKLSLRLEASGVVITKYALTSWTVKCVDRDTGEEIYFNTTLPKGVGSWASEGEALKAIGTKIADEFSRDFFLQHLNVTGRKVTLTSRACRSGTAADELGRELLGLPAVITATPRRSRSRTSTNCSSAAAAARAISSPTAS